MSTIPIKRVQRLPDACYARWVLPNRELVEHAITPDEYRAYKATKVMPNRTGNRNAVLVQCGARMTVTGGRRPQPGDLFARIDKRAGQNFFNDGAADTREYRLQTSYGGVNLSATELTNPEDEKTVTATRTLEYGCEIVDGALIEPDVKGER